MNFSSRTAARVRRTAGRSIAERRITECSRAGWVVGLVAGLAVGCSQRNEWRDHYIEAPAAPRPKPTPKPPETDAPGVDAAVNSAETHSSEGTHAGEAGADAAAPGAGSEVDAALIDAAPDAQVPLAEGAPLVDSSMDALGLDVFGTYSNRYWFVVSDQQVNTMNDSRYGGPIGMYGDIYNPGGGSGGKTYVDHLLVTNPNGSTADVGKVQATLVGGSTYRPWTESSLPNIKIDSNEFQDEVRIGGYEHLRFNNAIIGTIFREKFAFDFYRALGYPAPNAGYAWVSSTVWSPDVAVPYVVVESYKRQFCRDRDDYFGGECPNMWEFATDITWAEAFSQPDACQYSDCDATLATEMSHFVAQTPRGAGFKDATSAYIDWDNFHEFQCLSWLFGTTDDYVHGGNNTVLVERPDGKFQFLPYSVDISFHQEWAPSGAPLSGSTSLPLGCQSDAACWEDTIATCQVLVDAYVAADPVARLDAVYADLEDAGMLRQGDEARYEQMRAAMQDRLPGLNDELVFWRDNPNGNYGGYCPYPYVQCGDSCQLPQDCHLCGQEPVPGPGFPVPVPEPLPVPGGPLWLLGIDGGVAADAGIASSASASLDAGAQAETSATAASTDVAVDAGALSASAPSGTMVTRDAAVAPPGVEAGGPDATGYGSTGEDATTDGYTCQPYVNYYAVR